MKDDVELARRSSHTNPHLLTNRHPPIHPQDLPIDPTSPFSAQICNRRRNLFWLSKSSERICARNAIYQVLTFPLVEQIRTCGARCYRIPNLY
jgi:hypothetical protein